MRIVCLDLEGVLIPEIWIAFAEKTGVQELTRTTRDESNYSILMEYRLDILKKNNFTLSQIKEVIDTLEPLPGAIDFTQHLRAKFELIILSDTFREFVGPLMKKLGFPCLFCHELEVSNDLIHGIKLRLPDHKRKSVQYLQKLNFEVVAAGDSYNDLDMLKTANYCMLFNPPDQLIQEYPDIPVGRNYEQLMSYIEQPSL